MFSLLLLHCLFGAACSSLFKTGEISRAPSHPIIEDPMRYSTVSPGAPSSPHSSDLTLRKWKSVNLVGNQESVFTYPLNPIVETQLLVFHANWKGTQQECPQIQLGQLTDGRHVAIQPSHVESSSTDGGWFVNNYFETDNTGGSLVITLLPKKAVTVNVGLTTEQNTEKFTATHNDLYFVRETAAYALLGAFSVTFDMEGEQPNNPAFGTTQDGQYQQISANHRGTWSRSLCVDSTSALGFLIVMWNTKTNSTSTEVYPFTAVTDQYHIPFGEASSFSTINRPATGFTQARFLSHTTQSITVEATGKNLNGNVDVFIYQTCKEYNTHSQPSGNYNWHISSHWHKESYDLPDLTLTGAIVVLHSAWHAAVDFTLYGWGQTVGTCGNCENGKCTRVPAGGTQLGQSYCACYKGFQNAPQCTSPQADNQWQALSNPQDNTFTGVVSFGYILEKGKNRGIFIAPDLKTTNFQFITITVEPHPDPFSSSLPANAASYSIVPSVGSPQTANTSAMQPLTYGQNLTICGGNVHSQGLYIGTHYSGPNPPDTGVALTVSIHGTIGGPHGTYVYPAPNILGQNDLTHTRLGVTEDKAGKIKSEKFTYCVNNKFPDNTTFLLIFRRCNAPNVTIHFHPLPPIKADDCRYYGNHNNIWACKGSSTIWGLHGTFAVQVETTATGPVNITTRLIDNPHPHLPNPMKTEVHSVGLIASVSPRYALPEPVLLDRDNSFHWLSEDVRNTSQLGYVTVWNTMCGLWAYSNVHPGKNQWTSISRDFSEQVEHGGVYSIGGFFKYKRYSPVLGRVDTSDYFWEFEAVENITLQPQPVPKPQTVQLNTLIPLNVSSAFQTPPVVIFDPAPSECDKPFTCAMYIQLDRIQPVKGSVYEVLVQPETHKGIPAWQYWTFSHTSPMGAESLYTLPVPLQQGQPLRLALTPNVDNNKNKNNYQKAFSILFGIVSIGQETPTGTVALQQHPVWVGVIGVNGPTAAGISLDVTSTSDPMTTSATTVAVAATFTLTTDNAHNAAFGPAAVTTNYVDYTLTTASSVINSSCLADNQIFVIIIVALEEGTSSVVHYSYVNQTISKQVYSAAYLSEVYYIDSTDARLMLTNKDPGNLVQVSEMKTCPSTPSPISGRYGFTDLLYPHQGAWVILSNGSSTWDVSPSGIDDCPVHPNGTNWQCKDGKVQCRVGWMYNASTHQCDFNPAMSNGVVQKMTSGKLCGTTRWEYLSPNNPICYFELPKMTEPTTKFSVQFVAANNLEVMGYMGTDQPADPTTNHIKKPIPDVLNFTSGSTIDLCGVDMHNHKFFFTAVNSGRNHTITHPTGFVYTEGEWDKVAEMVSLRSPRSMYFQPDNPSARISVCIPPLSLPTTDTTMVIYPIVQIETCKEGSTGQGNPTAFSMAKYGADSINNGAWFFLMKGKSYQKVDFVVYSNSYSGHAEVSVYIPPDTNWPSPKEAKPPFTVKYSTTTKVEVDLSTAAAALSDAMFYVYYFDKTTLKGYTTATTCGIEFLAAVSNIQPVTTKGGSKTTKLTISGLNAGIDYVFAAIAEKNGVRTALRADNSPSNGPSHITTTIIILSSVGGAVLLMTVIFWGTRYKQRRRTQYQPIIRKRTGSDYTSESDVSETSTLLN